MHRCWRIQTGASWNKKRIKSCCGSFGPHYIRAAASAAYSSIADHSYGTARRKYQDEDDIVITGISGRFPQADTMEELKENLFSKKDMQTSPSRFISKTMPQLFGYVKSLDKFDAQFFAIPPKLVHYMDPQHRIVLEVAFEAIVDAGLNPQSLRGTPVGVFVGTAGGEAQDFWQARAQMVGMEGYGIVSASFALANRISYLFDFKGPSMALSTGCSASFIALESAVQAIHSGSSDAALIAGSVLHLSPTISIDFWQMGSLSKDGISKSFDASADGYARSETVSAMLIQKRKNAKRVYATVKHIQSNSDGHKQSGFTAPSSQAQEKLLRRMYKDAGVDPGKVKYLEAHGTGTPAGDPEEIQAVSNVFGKAESRTQPLLIGSVKSNLGHTESAAGMNQLAKIVIAAQEGKIPANLHFQKLRPEHEPLFTGDKAMRVVTEAAPFTGGIVGINSFGIGGTNVHLILDVEPRRENTPSLQNSDIPILLPFSGRTEDLVRESLAKACTWKDNAEFVGLVHNIFQQNITGHRIKGFALITPEKEEPEVQLNTLPFGFDRRPICFVFPGMGSQWNEMGKDMQRLDVFRESLRKSIQTYKNVGVDLEALLKPNNSDIFTNGKYAMCSITAIQVALYDTMISVGIKPDMFLGHSFGEIICGYADGTFTADETLLMAEARGRSFMEAMDAGGVVGGMAAVGMSWEEIGLKCPPNVYPACNNSADSVTISGEATAIKDFVKVLEGQGVFAKEVNSCGCAAHSKYVHAAADDFEQYVREFFPKEKEQLRSERWISSSVPESDWNTPLAKFNSTAYHANNIRSPVLFHEAVQKIPKDAAVIEIAPKGLFQAVLRGSLDKENFLVAPMTSGGKEEGSEEDKLPHFISSLGKIYNSGVDVQLGKLYPSVSFPVSAQTPGLSSLFGWIHEESWLVPLITNPVRDAADGMTMSVDLSKYEDHFLKGHMLGQRIVCPATAYLYLAWLGLALHSNYELEDLAVSIENVNFRRATFFKGKAIDFRFQISHSSGIFEIKDEGAIVCDGIIRKLDDDIGKVKTADLSAQEILSAVPSESALEETDIKSRTYLKTDEIYKELRLRGYNYSREFQGIQRIDMSGKWAEVAWNDNWIAFLDTVLQTMCMGANTRHTAIPVRLQHLVIDPIQVMAYVKEQKGKDAAMIPEAQKTVEGQAEAEKTAPPPVLPVRINHATKTVSAPGVEFRGLTASIISQRRQDELLSVEEYKFTPYFDDLTPSVNEREKTPISDYTSSGNTSSDTLARTIGAASIVDLVVENVAGRTVKILDVFGIHDNSMTEVLSKAINSKPNYKSFIKMVSTAAEMEKLDDKVKLMGIQQVEESLADSFTVDPTTDLVFLDQTVYSPKLLDVFSSLKENAFVAIHSAYGEELEGDFESKFTKIAHKFPQSDSNFALQLYRKKPANPVLGNATMHSLPVEGDSYEWLPKLKSLMAEAAEDAQNASSKPPCRIYLTSQNDPTSGVLGLVKCARLEEGGDKIRCIFDPAGKLDLNFEAPNAELTEILEKDLVINVVKGGKIGSYRHLPLAQASNVPTKLVEHAYVRTLTTGDLTSLRWIESELKNHHVAEKAGVPQVEGQTLYKVHYAALNFRDIMLASGNLPVDMETAARLGLTDASFGFEFSGVDPEGNRVMGMANTKALATYVLSDPRAVVKVPENWTLEEAATAVVVYLTVYYSFYKGKVQPKQSILIHSGTGGIGQAAINVALSKEMEIFTTVGTDEKRKFIKELYPSLKDENIGCSRDTSFEKMVLTQTNGQGVDIVLNSLADDKLQASVRCLARSGKFLEIGKFDAAMNTQLGMSCFLKLIEFYGIDAMEMVRDNEGFKSMNEAVQEGIDTGVVKPLARTVFEADQIEEAFRFMAGGKHMGKVLLKVRDEPKPDEVEPEPVKVLAMPRTYFLPDKTYIIVGGMGGMGLEVANWMAEKGAKHLILTSRSGVTTGYQALCLKRWAEKGVTVATPQIDLSNFDTAKTFIHDLSQTKTIGGIFNTSMVLKDDSIQNMTPEMFDEVATPKVKITKHLDKLSREYCPGLDHFVVFSSAACGRGHNGQSNYGWANSVMERVCELRREDGLHGLAMQWGVIGDVGYVAEKLVAKYNSDKPAEVSLGGTAAQTIVSCLETLDLALNQNCPVYSSIVMADDAGGKKGLGGILATFQSALGIKDISTVPHSTKLTSLGMDSLIAVEVKQTLERDYDISLTAPEVRNLTFGNLLAIDAGTFKKGDIQDTVKTIQEPLWPLETVVKLTTKASSLSPEEAQSAPANFPQIFFVPGIDGVARTIESLAAQLQSVECYGFQLSENMNYSSIKDMAAEYIQEMKLIQSEGPYNIGAFSSGGVLAFEMVSQLEQQHNEKVVNLVILDGFVTLEKQEGDGSWLIQQLLRRYQIDSSKMDVVKTNTEEENYDFFFKLLQKERPNDKAEALTEFMEKYKSYGIAIENHRSAHQYKGDTTLIKACDTADHMKVQASTYRIEDRCQGNLHVHTVKGSHFSFLNPPDVDETAEILNEIKWDQESSKQAE